MRQLIICRLYNHVVSFGRINCLTLRKYSGVFRKRTLKCKVSFLTRCTNERVKHHLLLLEIKAIIYCQGHKWFWSLWSTLKCFPDSFSNIHSPFFSSTKHLLQEALVKMAIECIYLYSNSLFKYLSQV